MLSSISASELQSGSQCLPACIILRATCAFRWGDTVTIVPHDMRTWDAPEKADILVSELLGSFGDNELSPECLDGAQRFLKVSHRCSFV